MAFPENPSGSQNIAGLSNANGNVLAIMPHLNVLYTQNSSPPCRAKIPKHDPLGTLIPRPKNGHESICMKLFVYNKNADLHCISAKEALVQTMNITGLKHLQRYTLWHIGMDSTQKARQNSRKY